MKRYVFAGMMLVFCVVCLQLVGAAIPAASNSLFVQDWGGATLYVGGTGPGNYTRIQQALDDASDGDTVFVYCGVYTETISIQKAVCLTGEDKNGTVIEGPGSGTVVEIAAEGAAVHHFAITGGGGDDFDDAAVYIASDSVVLQDTIIRDNQGHGVFLFSASYCILVHNVLVGNRYGGIYLTNESHFNNISYNTVQSGISGISVERSHYQTIMYNRVIQCSNGIYLTESRENLVQGNHLSDNEEGLFCFYAVRNTIQFNNFVSNARHARFMKFLHVGFIAPNMWRHNYWDDWLQVGVKAIYGGVYVRTFTLIGIFIPWVEVDWCPAREPYEWIT
ncbi:MAG: right-handed parallel beta-helix repeat-containing protein [Thermoplasmatota archaeon]